MLFDEIVFGPIRSRRLGTSLGINLLPTQKKFCNYDCVYCECGWNADTAEVKQKIPSRQEVKQELDKKVQELKQNNVVLDSITFAGNGEPTLHPEFAEIADDIILWRNEFFPNAKITVLSNATTLSSERIFNALLRIDNPVLKLDCGTTEMQKIIGKPASGKAENFQEIVNNLIRFGNKGIVQTLLLRGTNAGKVVDNTSPTEFNAYLEILKKIKPRYVMLYAIDRVTPESNLEKLTVEELEKYAQLIRKEGIEVQVFG